MDKHPRWKGGKYIDEHGYIRIWLGNKKWRYEHRLIMEKKINRPILRKEIVHHINGIKTDNRIENLELMSIKKHISEYHPHKRYSGAIITCVICGKQKYRKMSHIKRVKKPCCSIPCVNLLRKHLATSNISA